LTLKLTIDKRTNPNLLIDMANHYSNPKGFVGRNIVYIITFNNIYYGAIVGGSATLHLAGRNKYFNDRFNKFWSLNNIVNNLFFHIEPKYGKYPLRNFSQKILDEFQERIIIDWKQKYGDDVLGFETLIELPRTGEIYKRNKWEMIGQTIGYTCKRVAGVGTDNWSGKRVWNTKELKPKLVFAKTVKIIPEWY